MYKRTTYFDLFELSMKCAIIVIETTSWYGLYFGKIHQLILVETREKWLWWCFL